jgi:hypothetical protein
LRYAVNTPAFLGCSGAVAAVTAYKLFFNPGAMQLLVVLPVPLLLVGFLYFILEVKQLVGSRLGTGSGACWVTALGLKRGAAVQGGNCIMWCCGVW